MEKTKLYYNNGREVPRPKILQIDGVFYIPPTDDILLQNGYKPLYIDKDKNVEAVTYDEQADKVIKYINVVNLETIKADLLFNIAIYDNSDNVNIFEFSGVKMWLNVQQRQNLVMTLESAKNEGLEKINIPLGDFVFNDMNVSATRVMIDKIENYARECAIVTANHINEVKNITSIVDAQKYDYKKGYPHYLIF